MDLSRPVTPGRKLMGAGPLDIHPRVYKALASPVIGHLDPSYLQSINRIGDLLKPIFGTVNATTNAVPGTGTAGMECCIANLTEPKDNVLIGIAGYFGDRLKQMAQRYGADVGIVSSPAGSPVDPSKVEKILKSGKKYKYIALVHAETSTGILQPMDEIAEIARKYNTMLILDVVTSLGGLKLTIDRWGVDAAYACSQKCVGSPPGLSPVTFSDKAINIIKNRKTPVSNWYLDITLLMQYWDSKTYHHTSPSVLNYALLEALLLIHEEGLEQRFERHNQMHRALVAGMNGLGLKMLVEESYRLPTLNTVKVPDGINEAAVRKYLLDRYSVEISAGLGELSGKVWRIGIMGYSASPQNILLLITALSRALEVQGYKADLASALSGATSEFDK